MARRGWASHYRRSRALGSDWLFRTKRCGSLGSDWHRRVGTCLHGGRRGRSFLFGLLGLVLIEPAVEERDGGEEVVVEADEEVDVVEVFLAREAVGEVVAWIDGGAHFAAAWADEAEVAFAHFARGSLAAEGGDGDGHGQVVANATQQVR